MNTDFTLEEKFLIKRDKVLSNVIKTNGPIKFSKSKKDPFDTFVDIIISQFISTLAAKSIKEKMLDNFNEKKFKVENFEKLSVIQIKNLGLSLNKAKSIKEVISWLELQSMKNFFNLTHILLHMFQCHQLHFIKSRQVTHHTSILHNLYA